MHMGRGAYVNTIDARCNHGISSLPCHVSGESTSGIGESAETIEGQQIQKMQQISTAAAAPREEPKPQHVKNEPPAKNEQPANASQSDTSSSKSKSAEGVTNNNQKEDKCQQDQHGVIAHDIDLEPDYDTEWCDDDRAPGQAFAHRKITTWDQTLVQHRININQTLYHLATNSHMTTMEPDFSLYRNPIFKDYIHDSSDDDYDDPDDFK